jgi:LysM repeat protein
MTTYRVQSGDTLNAIAKQFGVSAATLASANKIKNQNVIFAGQQLAIPDLFETAAVPRSGPELSGAASSTPLTTTGPAVPMSRVEGLATWAPTSNRITTTKQANEFQVSQWGPTPYNSGGVPYGYSDCVPTSGLIAASRLGLTPSPTAAQASGAIDAMRDSSLGYDSTYSTPMNFSALTNGLAKYGATTQSLNFGTLTQIDAALERGNPVVAAGNPWNAWGASQDAAGNYLNHQDPGGHAITILGKTPEGKYLAADPLLINSTIEVSGAQLQQFFRDGYSNSGAMEVMRADGKPAPVVEGGSTTPVTPGPTSPLPVPQVELQRGMQSEQVRQLQNLLVHTGMMTQAQMNTGAGIYGPQTQNAVSALQDMLIREGRMTSAQKATGAGRFGPVTRRALEQHLAAA